MFGIFLIYIFSAAEAVFFFFSAKLIVNLWGEFTEYEPEFFPGILWKTEFGSVNLFQNGKGILLGCRSIEELGRLEGYVMKKVGVLFAGL